MLRQLTGLFTIYSHADNFNFMDTLDKDTMIISKYYKDNGKPNVKQLFNGKIETVEELLSKIIEVGLILNYVETTK